MRLRLTPLEERAVPTEYGGVEFPQGAASFADELLFYRPVGDIDPAYLSPLAALGTPDYPAPTPPADGSVTLGQGGELGVRFTNNLLTNGATDAEDVWIFEVGPDVESSFISLRPTAATLPLLGAAPDTDGFVFLGLIEGSTRGLDIDAAFPGHAAGELQFDAVKIVDDPDSGGGGSGSPGADIDSVGAIATVAVPRPATEGVYAVGGSDGSVRVVAGNGGVVTTVRPLDAGGVPYTGIVQVALGDLTGDGLPDLFVAPASPVGQFGLDPAKAGTVFVYDGAGFASGTVPADPFRTFTPFATTDGPFGNTDPFTNGLNIAAADVDGDGRTDLIAGTRGGTSSAGLREYGRLAVLSGAAAVGDNTLVAEIVKPFGDGYEKGVVVAGGDIDGDGAAEIAVTRGGPVVSTNPNKTVKLKAYRLAHGVLTEFNLSGGSAAFAPFEAVVGPNQEVLERDARVTFVDPDGDGKHSLVFSAIDRLTDPADPRVRIAVFGIDAATGLATPVGTGPGPSGSYLAGAAVVDHAIARADPDGDGHDALALATESASSGVQLLDPLTGNVLPGGVTLDVLGGGVTLDGV